MTSPNDILFGAGGVTAKFVSPGDTYVGPIVQLGASQQTDFKTRQPVFWPDGQPKMQVIVTLQTELRDPQVPQDDGQRKVFVKGKQLTDAVRSAVRGAGAKGLDVGGVLRVTYTHTAPPEQGQSEGAKAYEVAYQPPQAAQANAVLGAGAPAPQPPVNAATPQQWQPQQWQPAPQAYAQPAPPPPPAPVQQPLPQAYAPVMPPVATAAPPAPDLSALSPEARAVVEQMLANQQQPASA